MKKYKKDIIFLIIISAMVLFHLWTIKELKEDEQNLIKSFEFGKYREFTENKQRQMMFAE